MKKLSLSERLLRYLKNNHGQWFASGALQLLVTEKTNYSPANATRRLRKLAENGEIEVKYVKGHAHYSYTSVPRKRVQFVDTSTGVARITYKEVQVT